MGSAYRDISTDHDPLFKAHQWMANLRILEIDEIKTVAHVPLSHPFVERLVGTMRREFLDDMLRWNVCDLERKLAHFRTYYNAYGGFPTAETLSSSRSPPDNQFETDRHSKLFKRLAFLRVDLEYLKALS
jgi:putative transposase